VRSRDGQPATEVIFVNRTDGPLKRYWLDTQGKRRPYGEIPAGGVSSQSTFATHAWLIEQADGKVLGIYVPTAKVGRVVIEATPAATQPDWNAGAGRKRHGRSGL